MEVEANTMAKAREREKENYGPSSPSDGEGGALVIWPGDSPGD
jgi:hypothetical protein